MSRTTRDVIDILGEFYHKASHASFNLTLEQELALAILEGDEVAAWAAVDRILEARDPPRQHVTRAELIDMLSRFEYLYDRDRDDLHCPVCHAHVQQPHKDGCRLAAALGKPSHNYVNRQEIIELVGLLVEGIPSRSMRCPGCDVPFPSGGAHAANCRFKAAMRLPYPDIPETPTD